MSLDHINVELIEALVSKIGNVTRYIDDAPFNVDADAVVFIDDGLDTASFGWGAEAVLEQHLDPNEIEVMQNEGFYIKDEKIFAFSRFLLMKFIEQSFSVEVFKHRAETYEKEFTEVLEFINTIDGEGEAENDESANDFVKRIEAKGLDHE